MSESVRRMALFAVAGLLALLALDSWVLSPVAETRHKLATRIERAEKALAEAGALEKRRQEVAARLSEVAGASGDVNLFALLQTMAREAGVSGQIEYMRPSSREAGSGMREEIVDMRLRRVALGDMAAFLGRIEAAPEALSVRKLSFRADPAEGLNADVSISVPVGREQAATDKPSSPGPGPNRDTPREAAP
ncbi:hypothetical protein G3N56_17505 [Desulfovibrio sulfodismutans]|uniref:Type II secretion system protein M n=1 Tax=Desulfolutivibrio sulfodismutans TaxID=63561 RepID=A0A7K3NRS7_9BACT|nr:hypothetical protein [Desulfolutivibrio sulfodismutans]NDY58533.1 hypothetical protein [Desulfolutivibrio sulfodismutans]QLA14132.1 hypothetical protein GD606_18610 [Desulfolutivibrio sulfodismutans DSM 3696]